MKTNSFKILVAATVLLCWVRAHANFTNTFDSALPPEWVNGCQWSPGPADWPIGGSLQANATNGGWVLGDPSPKCIFNETQRADIRSMINAGGGHVRFSILVDGASFNASAQWWHINVVGNSAVGWTQINEVVNSWQNAGDRVLRIYTFKTNFAGLGWTDANSTYFEMNIGSNSDPANPIHYWIDNLAVYSDAPAVTPLVITAQSYNPTTREMTLTWTSEVAATYAILHSANVTVTMTPVATGIASGGAQTTTTVVLPAGNTGFVRIQKE